MTGIKEGDYVEWAAGREVYRVLSTSGEMASIGKKQGDIQRVYSVRRVELHPIKKEQAQAVLTIKDAIAQGLKDYEEHNRSLLRLWADQWEIIHKSREESR